MNVGCRLLRVPDDAQGIELPLAVLYPTQAPEQAVRFGAYAVDLAPDSPVAEPLLGLVMLSHGNSASPWTLRDLGRSLAQAGYVVGLPEHIGNSRTDNSLAGQAVNLENRPRHIRQCIDAILGLADISGDLPVAVGGISIGAYTALAVAGGRPWSATHENPDGQARPVKVVKDDRVRAVVLLAPATPWFIPEGSLTEVDVPVLMRSGELDDVAPSWSSDIVQRGLGPKAALQHEVILNAGHFSFLSPFPAEMTRPDFPQSQDPPGFDRTAYQDVLQRDVLAFLQRAFG